MKASCSWIFYRDSPDKLEPGNDWAKTKMAKNIAQLMVDTLVQAGVERVYGLPGDSLNGFTDSIRNQKKLPGIDVGHEETAAFAAGAEAHLAGRLAFCAGSCWPCNMQLVNGLYDCHRSRVPVLA